MTAKKKRNGKATTPVVEIAPTVGPLAAMIPDPVRLFHRIAFEADPCMELVAAVAQALDIPLDPQMDARLHGMTFDRMRGFRAEEVAPMRGALVRTGNAPHIAMVGDIGGFTGSIGEQMQLKLIALFFPEKPGQLPRMPERAGGVLTPEQHARVVQRWDGNITDKEAVKMLSPMKPERFAETVAEVIELRAVVSNTPGSTSTMLWCCWPDATIWPVMPIRHRPYREPRAPEDRVATWNRRTNQERGII